jgi:hypothetical protein
MAQDIDFSSCKYYAELIPPVSDTIGYELSQEWGSRIVVHSGRAHGLMGMGTVLAIGTYIGFPSGYFNNLPIIEVSQLVAAVPGLDTYPMSGSPISGSGLAFFTRIVSHSPYAALDFPSEYIIDYGTITVNGFHIQPTVDSVVSWFAKGV